MPTVDTSIFDRSKTSSRLYGYYYVPYAWVVNVALLSNCLEDNLGIMTVGLCALTESGGMRCELVSSEVEYVVSVSVTGKLRLEFAGQSLEGDAEQVSTWEDIYRMIVEKEGTIDG